MCVDHTKPFDVRTVLLLLTGLNTEVIILCQNQVDSGISLIEFIFSLINVRVLTEPILGILSNFNFE